MLALVRLSSAVVACAQLWITVVACAQLWIIIIMQKCSWKIFEDMLPYCWPDVHRDWNILTESVQWGTFSFIIFQQINFIISHTVPKYIFWISAYRKLSLSRLEKMLRYSALQYVHCTVQYSTALYSMYSTVQYCTVCIVSGPETQYACTQKQCI